MGDPFLRVKKNACSNTRGRARAHIIWASLHIKGSYIKDSCVNYLNIRDPHIKDPYIKDTYVEDHFTKDST